LGGVWQDFYMGALSGLLFGGAGTAIQSASNAVTDTRTGRQILDAGTVSELQQKIGALDSDIAQTANVPAVDGNSKARQLGAAQRGLERARTMENMRAELEARGEENVTPALLSGLYASSQRQEQRLTGEEKRAMRGSETAQELAEEWAKQWKDGSVPAPFAGAEDVLRERNKAAQQTAQARAERTTDTNELIRKLKDSIPQMSEAEPVATLQGTEFSKGEKNLVEQVGEFFRRIGNKVFRNGLGDVILNERGVKDDIAHGIGRAKAATFAAVPNVIADGKQIDYQENWKGRGKDSYVFAGPVDLGGQRTYVAAVVMRGADNHFYLHEVVDENGNLIYRNNNEAPAGIKTSFSPQSERTGAAGASTGTIQQTGNNGNSNFETEGITNGESRIDAASENGNDGVRAGEQSREAGTGEGTQPGGQSEVRQGLGQSDVEDLRGQDLTPAELGIRNGSDTGTVHVQTREEMSDRAREAEDLAQSRGYTTVPVTGELGFGNGLANAVIQDGVIYFRTDATYQNGDAIDPVSIIEHEITHPFTEDDADRRQRGMAIIGEYYGPKAIERMRNNYRNTYKDLYDFEHMSEDEIQAAIEKEMFGDAYSGMNDFRDNEGLKEEMQKAFPEIREGQNQAIESGNETRGPPEGRAQAFIGYDEETGKGIYESNYPENSPAAKKSKRIVDLVQNLWSKKPIDLVIQNEDGTTQVIQAKFDPDFDETGNRKTDLGKLAYGNRQGNKNEKRVTLNLADDMYQIIQDARYIESGENYDPVNHPDVEIWHYFVNDILYRKQGEEEARPYSIYIDVKQTADGDYVYTFYAREDTEKNNGQTTPQTVYATVNSSEDGTANGLPNDSIDEEPEKSNPKNEGRASTEVPAEGKLWIDDGTSTQDMAKAAEEGRTVAMENGSGRIEIRRTSKGNYAVEFYDRAEEAYGERPSSTAMFKTAGEAAEYADAYRGSYQTALEDRELDEARGKPERGKPKGEAGTIPAPFAGTETTAAEDYNNEVIRQKKAKAAEVNTQTLRERIRRADEELRALRRLDKTTGLTEAQKAHKADVQETLEIMNDELQRRKAQAKANRGKGRQKKNSRERAVKNAPTKSARDARLALQDMFSTRRGAWNETGKAIDEKLAEIARSGRISEESRQELFDILIENGAVYKEAEEVFRNIRDTVRGSRLYVSEHDRHDFGDNWDSLRKRAFAAGIYLTNDITDQKVDSLVQELGETFGENLFPQDEALSDMLNNLIERSEQGRNTWQPLSESIEDEAKRYREDPQEIFDSMWEQMNRTLQTFAEKADLEIDLKERSAAQLAEERQRWEDRMERRSRARLESEIRGKVLKGLQRLARAKNKTAPDTKAQIEEVLKDIDTQARQITPAGLEDLQGLYRAYEDAKKDAGYQDDENMGNWIPNPYVEERLARLTQKHVNDMSIDEVIELGRTVAALEHSIATQNQMLGEEWDRTITEE
ncbi:MAG: hypothetical protein K5746_10115, partial [Clostridiales bacterium]|nr:hypothetical protein [Clostridiales bacterium]